MTSNNAIKLIVSLALPLLVGAVAGVTTAKAIPSWYASLNQPSFSPPNWIFGPVWTSLYIVMGISLYLVWVQPPGRERNLALIIFGIQLMLNFGWSYIFFYYKNLGLAFVEIIVLWVAIIFMVVFFHRLRPLAAYLNIPYLAWVTFASILNGAYYRLN